VFGISTTPVLVVHALLGALACGLLYLLGRRLFDPVIALGGALLFSVNVHHLWWGQYVLSESLLIALQVAAVLALVAFVQQPTGFRAARAGLVFGTTALCNPLILPLPFVLAGAFAMFGRPRAPLLRGTAILLIAMWVVVVPWTARNHRAFHTFLPVNWGLGFQFVKGSMLAENLRAAPRGSLGQTDLDATRREVEILRARGFAEGTSEEQFRRVHRTMTVNRVEDSVLTAVVREELRRDPASLVRKLSVTWRTFWTFSIRQRDVALVASLMVLGLALAGIVTYTDRRLDRLTALLFGLHLYLSYALVLSVARYSAQVFPVLSLFAAAAVVGVVRRVRGVAGDTVPRRA
jgi:4-amino-4-deoxy-L-arabinose transferase-like glycosyltransferase